MHDRIEALVIAIEIDSELMRVGPVELSISGDIMLCIAAKSLIFVDVREQQQTLPIFGSQFVRRVRHRRANHRLIATEDAFREKLGRVRIDVELEVAVQKASLDATTRGVGSVIDINHANHAAHGNARAQAQRDRHDHAEESVSTDGEREEFRIVTATAQHRCAARINERERFHVMHDRRHRQPATVRVGAQRASKRECICTRLFLRDSPVRLLRWSTRALQRVRTFDQRRPLDPCFNRQQTMLHVESNHTRKTSHIDQLCVAQELLSTHRMTRSTHRHRFTTRRGEHDHFT